MEDFPVESVVEVKRSKYDNIRETLLQVQETLARHEKELMEPYAVQEAIFQMTAVTKKVEQITLDINNIREKSYEASVLALGGSGNGGSDAGGALKLLRGDLEALRMVSRRIELHQSTEALSFHNLRELQRGSRRTTSKVDELERQVVNMKADHAREMAMLKSMIQQNVGGRKTRMSPGQEEEDDDVSDDEDNETKNDQSVVSQHYQRLARRRKRIRHRRAHEGFDLDIGALDDELEEIARGLDTHMTTIGTLQNDVARLEQQRHDDHLHYTVTTGARMLSHILRARQKTAVRRRWEAWQHMVSIARLQSTKSRAVVMGVDRRLAGHALILQQALARVGCWPELRMRPRFQRWREHTERERHAERWQPVFARCLGKWRAYPQWLLGPVLVSGEVARRCLRQWKRVTALAIAGLATMTNLSLAQQAEPYLLTTQGTPEDAYAPSSQSRSPIKPATSSSVAVVVDENKQARFVASLLRLLATNSDNNSNSNINATAVDTGTTTMTRAPIVSDDVDTAAAASVVCSRAGDPLLKMGYVRDDLEALAVVAGLVCRLGAARQARFEVLRAADAGAALANMQGVGVEVGARLEQHREQLAHSLMMVQRGAEEAVGGCREDLVRRLHETGVTFDNKLASTAFRIRSLDAQMTETVEGARRIEEQVMLSNSKLEKVLLENGSQVMRLAGLETAHTHYLADRVKADRERQVLQHVTGEISLKLVDLANSSASHEGQVRAELDRLVRGSSALSEHVGGLDVRLAQATASTASQESRLTTVEQIAAGLVTHEPTGSELCRLCLVFEDRVLRQHNKNGITGQTIGTGNSPPPSSGGGGGSGLPSVHLNMVLDDDTAEQLARFVVRLAHHVASRCDTAVVCGTVQDPRAPPFGAGPVAAGPGKQHLAGKDWHNTHSKHHPLTAEEEVLARRDAFIRDFEGDFIRALKDSGNGNDSGSPGVLRCEARVVFHRRFVSALELALTAHPVMALESPSALGRTSSQNHHGNQQQPPPPGPLTSSSHVHTSVVTKEVGTLLLPQSHGNGGGDRARSGPVRPRSASAAGRLMPRTGLSGGAPSSLGMAGMTMTTTNPNTSLAGLLEAQLLRGDYDSAHLTLGGATTSSGDVTAFATTGGAPLATSASERTLLYNSTTANQETIVPGTQQQLNASGSQACLACNRPLRDATGSRQQPRLSSLPWLLSSFEQEMALLSTQDRVARHSALAAGAIVQAATTLHSTGSLAHQTAGWTQGQHHPYGQHPSRPLSADHSTAMTRQQQLTAPTTNNIHHHRSRSAAAAVTSSTMVMAQAQAGGDRADVNCAASHDSSDLGQLSQHSNRADGSNLNPSEDRIRPRGSSNVIASLLLSGKSIEHQHDDNDIHDGPGLGLGMGD